MARKTVANLETTVTARDAGFTAELNRMRNQVDRLSKQTSRLSGGFSRMGNAIVRSLSGPLAGIVTVRAAFTEFGDAVDRLDNLKDAATAIDISAAALAGLRYAAKFAGIEATQLDKALTRLVVRVQEAAGGDKSAQKFFDGLRLSVEELATLKPDALFLRVSDAIGRLGDANKISAATVELFGEKQAKFITLMRQGPGVLRSYVEEQARLNMIGDDTAANAEKSADALGRLSEAWDGLWNAIASGTPLVPVIDAATKTIAPGAGGVGGGFAGGVGPAFLLNLFGGGGGLEEKRKESISPSGAGGEAGFGGGRGLDFAPSPSFQETDAGKRFAIDVASMFTVLGAGLPSSWKSRFANAERAIQRRREFEAQTLDDLFAPIPKRREAGRERERTFAPSLAIGSGELAQLQAAIQVGAGIRPGDKPSKEETQKEMLRVLKSMNARIALLPGGGDNVVNF